MARNNTIFAVAGSLAAGVAILGGCSGGGNDGGGFGTNGGNGGNGGGGGRLGVIGVWATTSVDQGGGSFRQMDRLARPVVNEVLATVANDRHKVNDEIPPTQDPQELAGDIQKFFDDVFSFAPNGRRSQATVDVVKAVLVPDVMKADLSVRGSQGAYLGVETAGATGSRFGGRELSNDVVDVTLGIVFGTTISALGLAPADNKQIPTLTSDNVGAEGKGFTNSFPYLGDPQ